MSSLNIFTHYDQEENQFTNGLISILSLSTIEGPQFVASFLLDELGLRRSKDGDTTFRVLKGIKGTADGELCGEECRILFETKIVSGMLEDAQILAHLAQLRTGSERLRRLVLLTPDDSQSTYVQTFLAFDTECILHLAWKRVYSFLENSQKNELRGVLSELVRQFLVRIRQKVFEQDVAGIIQKVQFGEKSGIFENTYLGEMETRERWNTPRQYKSLDGTGRKLMLYDKTRQGITIEVEIRRVHETGREPDYPWANEFAPGTLHRFVPPIPLSIIRSVKSFENFGVPGTDRSAYRNITRQQYQELMQRAATAVQVDPRPS
jgi:hypothetical protein